MTLVEPTKQCAEAKELVASGRFPNKFGILQIRHFHCYFILCHERKLGCPVGSYMIAVEPTMQCGEAKELVVHVVFFFLFFFSLPT